MRTLLRSIFLPPARYADFLLQTFARVPSIPRHWGLLIDQMERVGVRSVVLVVLTGFFMGAIITWQGAYQVKNLAPVSLLCGQIVKVLVMEVGPILTALVLAGRIGSALAAEIGAMRVTEQIDALRSLTIDPMTYLVVPRVVGTTLMMPALTLFSILAGVLGSWAVLSIGLGVSTVRFGTSVQQYVEVGDLSTGLGKSLIFGLLLSSLGCWQGFQTTGGSLGVSKATVGAFVAASIALLLADFIIWAIVF